MSWNKNDLEKISKQNHKNLTLDSTGIVLKNHSSNETGKGFKLYKIPEEDQLFAIVVKNNNGQSVIIPLGEDDTLSILENSSCGESIAQKQFLAM